MRATDTKLLPLQHDSEDATTWRANSEFSNYCQLLLEQITSYLPGTSAQFVYCNQTSQNWQKMSQQSSGWTSFESFVQSHFEFEQWLLTYSGETFDVIELPIQGHGQIYVFPIYLPKCVEYSEYLLLGSSIPLTKAQQRWVANQVKLFKHHLLLTRNYQKQQSITQSLIQSIRETQHQVQNPLALIEIYSTILNRIVPDNLMRSHITGIQEALQTLTAQLHHLSPTSQKRELNINKHDVKALVIDVVQELEPWLKQKHLTVQYPTTSLVLAIDYWYLKQVFINLINNALYFSPAGQTIYCDWQVLDQEVLVQIWDEGSGLSDVDLKNLFTPFYSRRPNGNGLGLAIAQQIVQDHGGQIWAKNMPGKGANFSFTLSRSLPAELPGIAN